MDFFRLLPLSAVEKVVGILVGRNLIVLGLSLVNTLATAVCGFLAGASMRLVVEFLIACWVGAAVAMLMALLFSTYERRGKTTSSSIFVLLLVVFVLPYVIGAAANWQEVFPNGAYLPFFAMQVRLFVFLTLLALYTGAWAIVGLVRRFNSDRAPLFTPAGVFWSTLGTYVIIAGLAWGHLRADGLLALMGAWSSSAIILLMTTLGAFRSWEDYLEARARCGKAPGMDAGNLSNLALGIAMILSWCAFAALTDLRAGMPVPPHAIVSLALFWFVLIASMEFSATHVPLAPSVHVLTGFLIVLYLVVPLIFAAALERMDVGALSPIGSFIRLADDPDATALQSLAPVGLNIAISAVLLRLITRRYDRQADAGVAMPEDQRDGQSA
jgi:hypothetical protein